MVERFYVHVDDRLVTIIDFDKQTHELKIQNFTDDVMDRVFGINQHPEWWHFERWLEERMPPQQRPDIKQILQSFGLDHYDPLEFVKRTRGQMWGDHVWISFEGEDLKYADIKYF